MRLNTGRSAIPSRRIRKTPRTRPKRSSGSRCRTKKTSTTTRSALVCLLSTSHKRPIPVVSAPITPARQCVRRSMRVHSARVTLRHRRSRRLRGWRRSRRSGSGPAAVIRVATWRRARPREDTKLRGCRRAAALSAGSGGPAHSSASTQPADPRAWSSSWALACSIATGARSP